MKKNNIVQLVGKLLQKMSYADIASKVGYTETSVRQWAKGYAVPKAPTIAALRELQ